ncbi:uncharacterized protein SPPG_01877 [Spizellomyces punctatus DAOM BR117]|uniref:Uncharacterized protein n=1 Tax=Spizellomyces punctatus (strain DAOM BR117) TaxID=645134 RepID=A0A0L0HMZ9_SPIPD|nr:uncharacterized protein SPPG_01877 [Spizellomyces punctatus DAOM BR117]KND02796.1 hypothetical protein SPPG_01877 [Spizellomyces punctatus DAOM BR117]|eukprot:XP_016610835.1 hypothetical protein SPPG_01877 [Spizellomyces punctatus DAOM BR117]
MMAQGNSQDFFRMDVHDWRYEMRREMQEILPGLWLGPYQCSKNKELLKSKGITHVLCIRDSNERHVVKTTFPDDFVYHVIEVSESPMQNLIPYFPDAKQFIDYALEQGGRVLVHCNSGISRSPSFVVAYVMMSQRWGFQESFTFVQNKRFCMNPNEGFKYQLKEFEPIWRASDDEFIKKYTHEQILQQGKLKRMIDDDGSDEQDEMQIAA